MVVCIALKCKLYKDIQTTHSISFTPEQPQPLVSIYSWLTATASKLSDGWSCLPPACVGVAVGNLGFRVSFPLHECCSGCIVRPAKSQSVSARGCSLAFRTRLNTHPGAIQGGHHPWLHPCRVPSLTSLHLRDLVCLHIWVLTTTPHTLQVFGPRYS